MREIERRIEERAETKRERIVKEHEESEREKEGVVLRVRICYKKMEKKT